MASIGNNLVIPPDIERIPEPKLAESPNNKASKAIPSTICDIVDGTCLPVRTVIGAESENGNLRL